jgi:hypothetical protein
MATATMEATITPTGSTTVTGRKPRRATIQLAGGDVLSRDVRHQTAAFSRAPKRIRFGGALHPKLRVTQPIPLDIKRSEKLVVVENQELEEFGSGVTLGDALADFGSGLAELFFRLEDDKDRLGPDLQRLRQVIARFVALR